jgi:Uma2 family endonuclease
VVRVVSVLTTPLGGWDIYAPAGVQAYWLVDLLQHRIEVYTQPAGEGADYGRCEVLGLGQDVGLPGLDLRWPVADLIA